jgi:hypothetical protein
MKRLLVVCLGSVAALAVGSALSLPAKADKAFRDEFIAVYVKADSSDAKDKDFAEACDKAKCNICHVGKKKSDRNAYGTELAKLLDREKDAENKQKIRSALNKVADMKADPKDAVSPTFGERIRSGKLPVLPVK